ncbi:MAG TPA: glycosyltransferase family 39 protein, partial [Polyangiaceae bacterium]|nr:glycosyltransferase family 39 protein [Polyangiaceae bacterium]
MPSDDEAPAAPEGASPSLEAVTNALAAADDDSSAERLIPKGNPSRPKQLWLVLASLVPLFLLMACDRHFGFSVPLGSAALLVASFGVLDAFGTFDDAPSNAESPAPPSLRSLTPRLVELGAAVVSVVGALRVAVAGFLPHPVLGAAVLVTGTLIWLVVSLCRLAHAARIFQAGETHWFARGGFWLVLLNILLYVPLLGSYSLSDPWEAHYGEVSREMLARDDWISLWWAQDGWFWSKPVLDFWLQGLGFSL